MTRELSRRRLIEINAGVQGAADAVSGCESSPECDPHIALVVDCLEGSQSDRVGFGGWAGHDAAEAV